MLAALLYSTAGLALTSVGALGLMAAVAFSSIFFAVVAGEVEMSALKSPVWLKPFMQNACNFPLCMPADILNLVLPFTGVMLSIFVGAVATTLTFASLGLVAVASGAATTATAGTAMPHNCCCFRVENPMPYLSEPP